MKSKIKSFIQGSLVVFVSVLAISTIIKAGVITPPSGTPAAQFYTLSEIYTRLTTNATSAEGGHDFAFSDSLAGTSRTLTEIYDAIPTIVADTVKLGTSYLGVDGTLVPSGGDAATADICLNKTYFGASQTDWTLATGALTIDASKLLDTAAYCGVTGSIAVKDNISGADGSKIFNIPDGYYSGKTATCNDTDLVVGNIKKDIIILGETGTLAPSGTAAVADVCGSKTFYSGDSWTQKTGNRTACSASSTDPGVGNVYYNTAYNIEGADKTGTLQRGCYSTGNAELGAAGNFCGDNTGDAAVSDIIDGKFAWVDGSKIEGTIANCSAEGGNTCYAASGYWTSISGSNVSGGDGLKTFNISDGYYSGKTATCNDADLAVGNIKKDVIILGVTGTLQEAQDFSRQMLIEYDDWENGAGMAGEYTGEEATWTETAGNMDGDCLDANDVCKDERTGLYWSDKYSSTKANNFSATHADCPYFTLSDPADYDGADADCGAVGDDATEDAINYCATLSLDSNGGDPETDWYLPTQKELMQAYIDGSANNLPSPGYTFWSSTETSWSSARAWRVYLYNGDTYSNTKTTSDSYYVRCVRR